jgi:hypothetical protein
MDTDPPWNYKAFGDIASEQRDRNIKDKEMCGSVCCMGAVRPVLGRALTGAGLAERRKANPDASQEGTRCVSLKEEYTLWKERYSRFVKGSNDEIV